MISAIEVSKASLQRVFRGPLWDGGICEFACQGDVVVSPPLGFFGSWGKQCASSGPLVFLCFSHVVIV